MAQLDDQQGQPSWGYLIVLGLVAIALINLIAASFVLLLQPSSQRYWVLGTIWACVLLGLTRLPRLLRSLESRSASTKRRPRR